MLDVDQIVIHFNPNQVNLLNLCLGLIMFGVALDINLDDFKYIGQKSSIVLYGLLSQWVLLPLLTIFLVWVISPAYSIALGMLLVAVCPGGNVSNYAVHLAKGNVALSIVLTTISTLLCVVSTPFLFNILSKMVDIPIYLAAEFHISMADMMMTILQLIIIPLVIGLALNHYLPKWSLLIKKPVQRLSMVIFLGFVIFGIIGNLDNLKNYLYMVFFIVLTHNGLALLLGYIFAKYIVGLTEYDSRAISIETGIQNSGLALIIIFNFFNGLGGMALIAAWWSIWHLISAFGLSLFWNRTVALAK